MPKEIMVPLTENIFWVRAPGKAKLPFCNGFLLKGSRTILIDAGIGRDRIREIDAKYRIDTLVISHSHIDHMLAWDALKDRTIMMPVQTPDAITDLIELGKRFTPTVEQALDWVNRVKGEISFIPMRLPDVRYGDGDVIDAGGVSLEAIHAPGHLDDHYCFYDRSSGLLLTTDIDFGSFGPWYGNPEASIPKFIESIEKVRSLPLTIACSSHKNPVRGNQEIRKRFDRFLSSFERHKELVLKVCRRPVSLEQIVDESPFYRNLLPNKKVQKIFERQMIRKNLDILLEENRLETVNGHYVRTL